MVARTGARAAPVPANAGKTSAPDQHQFARGNAGHTVSPPVPAVGRSRVRPSQAVCSAKTCTTWRGGGRQREQLLFQQGRNMRDCSRRCLGSVRASGPLP